MSGLVIDEDVLLAYTNRDARIYKFSNGGGEVRNPIVGKRYIVSPQMVAVLEFALNPRTPAEIRDFAVALCGESADALTGTLVDRELLVSSDPPGPLSAVESRWRSRGWDLAFDYEQATFDYPCLDYAAEGAREDKARMVRFLSESSEPDRYKDYGADSEDFLLPSPSEASAAISDLSQGAESRFTSLLALTFAAVGTTMRGSDRPPFILRTSPSGGGRSPSEGYVARIVNSESVSWKHVRSDGPAAICRTECESSMHEMKTMFAPLFDEQEPFAVVAVTSQFDRNMYRYREPRTFRTVHMDAGHLLGTAAVLAEAAEFDSQVSYCEGAALVESALRLNPLLEGYMGAIGLYARGEA